MNSVGKGLLSAEMTASEAVFQCDAVCRHKKKCCKKYKTGKRCKDCPKK
jgi:hypothetical protein